MTATSKVYNGNAAATWSHRVQRSWGCLAVIPSPQDHGCHRDFASTTVGTGIVVTVAGSEAQRGPGRRLLADPADDDGQHHPRQHPTVSVSAFGGTYSGSEFMATASVAGVVDHRARSSREFHPLRNTTPAVTATGMPLPPAPIDAGTYTVVANFPGSTDYISNTSQPVTLTIIQATPIVERQRLRGVFTTAPLSPQPASPVWGSPGSELDGIASTPEYYAGSTATGTPLSVPPIDAGTYTVAGDFPGSTDYTGNTSPARNLHD